MSSPASSPPKTNARAKPGALLTGGGVPLPAVIAKQCAKRWEAAPYLEGQTLFYQGHASYGAFLVCSGTVGLLSDPEGEPVPAAKQGTMLGTREMLTGRTFEATAVVVGGPARICFIDKTSFLSLLASQDRLMQAIMRVLLPER